MPPTPISVARGKRVRAMVINTGNANAGTGADGLARARRTCATLAAQLQLQPQQILPFSTGVIMETLPVERIEAGLPAAIADLKADNWAVAAEGIMTTLHYADGLQSKKNDAFRLNYAKTFKLQPDAYAVAGYDSAMLLAAGLKAAGGDLAQQVIGAHHRTARHVHQQRAIGQAQRPFRPLQGAAGGDGPGHYHRQQRRTGAFHMYLDDP